MAGFSVQRYNFANTPTQRADASQQIRVAAAQTERNVTIPPHLDNGDETLYQTKIGNYSKGLPHNDRGEVVPAAYQSFLTAINSGQSADFEKIVVNSVPLVDPQAGLAFDLEGTDSQQLTLPAPPSVASETKAAEAVELYWMALLRDVHFAHYSSHEAAEAACRELSRTPAFSRLLDWTHETVTPATLFRGFTDGDLQGPYISQFLYQTLQFGAAEIIQRFQTLLPIGRGGTDWMTDFPSWLDVQNGAAGTLAAAWKTPSAAPNRIDPVRRYIRCGRDISQYVHIDVLFEAYFNACLYLIHVGAPLNPGNPYQGSKTQTGFGTFGSPHIKAIVAEVATRALKAVWFQKWFVHRHLRPEAYGGLVHNALTGVKQEVTLPSSILNCDAVQLCFTKNGSYLLPHAFPEGCPQHPSYGQGHATVAGACTTIIKAFFDGGWQLTNPVVPTEDGLHLVPYHGPDTLTLNGELHKLASNIGLGRNHAAVHYRSDYTQSLLLGERLAVSILQDQLPTYNELPLIQAKGWNFMGFAGNTITLV